MDGLDSPLDGGPRRVIMAGSAHGGDIMDCSPVGATGNLLGALGVVVSLVYLGMQIKHQIREARVTAAKRWGQMKLFTPPAESFI